MQGCSVAVIIRISCSKRISVCSLRREVETNNQQYVGDHWLCHGQARGVGRIFDHLFMGRTGDNSAFIPYPEGLGHAANHRLHKVAYNLPEAYIYPLHSRCSYLNTTPGGLPDLPLLNLKISCFFTRPFVNFLRALSICQRSPNQPPAAANPAQAVSALLKPSALAASSLR